MANLLFRPKELLSEVDSLQKLAARFLDLASPFQLDQLAGELRGLVTQKRGPMTWEIPEDRPLRTRVSQGEFETAGRSSNRRVYAEVTGIWVIEAAGAEQFHLDRSKRKTMPPTLIGFTGRASTVITVFDEDEADPIAHWKMELGDARAPGCFFHTHFASDDSFPVPRHPNVFPTPMSAIGFVLGELFQGEWEEVVSGATDPPNRWRSIQGKRLKALLQWQLAQVDQATSSPWVSMKVAKPAAAIFL